MSLGKAGMKCLKLQNNNIIEIIHIINSKHLKGYKHGKQLY